jgi:hypothetical protein
LISANKAAEKAKAAVDTFVESKQCKALVEYAWLIKSKVMKLDVEIKNPFVMVPRHSNSDEVLLVDLGKITITNKFALVQFHTSS